MTKFLLIARRVSTHAICTKCLENSNFCRLLFIYAYLCYLKISDVKT